jgi:transcriptional regulator of acetoin/glycerol metabolism
LLADPGERAAIRRRLDRAWQAFVGGGEPEGVRPQIARSWRRARDLHHVPATLLRAPLLPPEELARRREDDEVLALAAPILADFAGRLRDLGHVLALLDGDGCVLSLDGDAQVLARGAEIHLCPGACWREDAAGTSGAGIALVECVPVEVIASEHWVEAWHGWTSAAAPILPPGAARPAGLVGVAGPWDAGDPRALGATAAAIAGIVEERLRARLAVRDELVRYALRAARDAGDALVAVDARGRLLVANDAARRRLPLEGDDLPRGPRERLAALLRASPPDDELTIPWPGPGDERRRVFCSAVSHAGRAVGAILRLAPAGPRPPRPGARPGAPAARYGFGNILGASERLRTVIERAQLAARNDLPLVFHGESGTGKELFAHGVHAASARAAGPFVTVNCGAIPASLIEAELFGYEAGTFTGAARDGRAGKLEEAHGGTLFLDEVSELSPQGQTALLRVLQESEVIRLGGIAPRRVDVRVVAATNKRLADEVAAGRFRQDLFFRLNVLAIDIPPLRERPEDVEVLARAFLEEAAARTERDDLVLSDEALAALARHPWPGNVRELRNVMLRAAAMALGPRIGPDDLQLEALRTPAVLAAPPPPPPPPAPAAEEGSEPEREELVAALDRSAWNIARAATSLGVSRMTLYRRLRKYGISR